MFALWPEPCSYGVKNVPV